MHALVQTVGYLNLVAFAAVWLAAVRQWQARRHRAALWAMLAFAALAVVVVVAQVLPEHPGSAAAKTVERLDVAVLLTFPYFLYRFTTAFRLSPRRLDLVLGSMTVVMVIWTLSLPRIPESGEPRPAWFVAYLAGFLVHWGTLSVLSSVRLWRAGRGQPSVSRRRMQLLAGASAALTLAIFLVVASTDPDSPLAAASGLLGFVSALAFYLGLAPPTLVRLAWRRPEQRRLQEAIQHLMARATSRHEVASRVLGPTADIVGAHAVAVRDADGRVVAAHDLNPEGVERRDGEPGQTVLEVGFEGGTLLVWTTPYAPFFGDEEVALLRTLGALTGVALDRVRLFEQEREARLALERADEVKTNFIALAAHELRTPITTIYGFVRTLVSREDELTSDQRTLLKQALDQQTTRMSLLVEQLLDLSRLDAEAVEIRPVPVAVRARVEQLGDAVLSDPEATLEIDVPEDLEIEADPAALERILTNLLTNAARYGKPPIVVRARHADHHVRVSVEDRGPGVEPEFVPDLFGRFTRSNLSREQAGGTGLGLAIARSFARAHGGELLYEPVEPSGARFQLVLPVTPPQAGIP